MKREKKKLKLIRRMRERMKLEGKKKMFGKKTNTKMKYKCRET